MKSTGSEQVAAGQRDRSQCHWIIVEEVDSIVDHFGGNAGSGYERNQYLSG